MKRYVEIKVESKAIQQQVVGVNNNEFANSLRELKRLCKEFSFTAEMLKGATTVGLKER